MAGNFRPAGFECDYDDDMGGFAFDDGSDDDYGDAPKVFICIFMELLFSFLPLYRAVSLFTLGDIWEISTFLQVSRRKKVGVLLL